MAIPNSKSTFKEYCLRALGKGVIDINVSDDQADDRIDEALQYYLNYHSDGVERVYLKHQLTEAEITRMKSNETAVTATDGNAWPLYYARLIKGNGRLLGCQ